MSWSMKNGYSGPILESKGMHAIFQKKGQKEQNIWKFGQKCTKFEKGQSHVCDYCMHETARLCPGYLALLGGQNII